MATSIALLADGVYGPCSRRQVFSKFCVVGGISESTSSDKGRIRRLRTGAVVSSEPIGVTAESVIKKEEILVPKIVERGSSDEKYSIVETSAGSRETTLLIDDTYYKTDSVKDYLDLSKDLVRPDGGPIRWFCPVECGDPVKDAPLLLFLPGTDGTGLGLITHHRALGRMFEVRCMHIPIFDRTPFEGLVKFVEEMVQSEHKLCPNRPIYLVGDSFGGCLALAVAARNPTIDLVLILSNPATSFPKSPLWPFLPLLESIPDQLHIAVPYLLSMVMGDPVKMALVDVEDQLPLVDSINQLSENLVLADIIPKETLLWKLKLLKSASSYTNSRLHAVKADVLVLASGKDNLLPSRDEAERLWHILSNCKVRYFKDNGHTLLMEDGIHLATIIKSTSMYRRSRRFDYVMDYLPPTLSEFRKVYDGDYGWFQQAVSPVMLSTLKDGSIVRGLAGIPEEGPVLLVGYHMLMGLEMYPLVGEFLRQKNVLIRGLAHPMLFSRKMENARTEPSSVENIKLFGAVPVTPTNFFRLLSTKSFVLLYPGGAREALHRKGEAYKLFWPAQSEFVRMAARFGATIVPFAAVGEDDVAELVIDYNDQMSFPVTRQWIEEFNENAIKLRAGASGEVENEALHLPGLLPKVPGRFYYYFGKPIETSTGLTDKEEAHSLYLHIKSDVERMFEYLRKKRDEDPYRSIVQRSIFQATWGSDGEIPTFEL
ncbi:Acyltransferase-like protein [Nymphaea thermarum]|nr:Acyltransferase-like protein [Nymphaea thermarum]